MGDGVTFTTIGGTYKAGDTRNPNASTEWLDGFDNIDVAPKNGTLSPEEIIAYRDKQTKKARIALNTCKILMFPKMFGKTQKAFEDGFTKISQEEKETSAYRQMLKAEQMLKNLKEVEQKYKH